MIRSGDKLGEWRLEGSLGALGPTMAWKARNPRSPERLARIFALELGPGAPSAEDLFREADALKALAHPARPGVLGHGVDLGLGVCWMAEAWIDGVTLEERMSEASFTPRSVEKPLAEALSALAGLHEARRPHGALSPRAILIDREGGGFLSGAFPLLHAARLPPMEERTWLSPERLVGRTDRDALAEDIYSLGLVLHTLLTGRVPFEPDPSSHVATRLFEHMKKKAEADGLDVGAAAGVDLRRLIKLATAREPSLRSRSLGAFLAVIAGLPDKLLTLPEPGGEAPPEVPPEEPGRAFRASEPRSSGRSSAPAARRSSRPGARPLPSVPEPGPSLEYAAVRTRSWKRFAFVLLGLLLVVAAWLSQRKPAVEPPPPAPRTVMHSRERREGTARSPEYVYPESWRYGISAETWARANFPRNWLLSIAPDSWRRRALVASPSARRSGDALELRGGRDLSFMDEFGTGPHIHFEGIWTTREFVLPIPESWRLLRDPQLLLDLAVAPVLLPEVSVLGIWGDGEPTGSVSLAGARRPRGRAVIPLRLAPGPRAHTLRFTTYHRSEIPCETRDLSGLWSEIGGGSIVRVFYERTLPRLDLSRWPVPFVEPHDPDPSRIVFLLPEDPTEAEALAMARIAAALGKASEGRPLDLQVQVGDRRGAPEGHAIALLRASGGREAGSTLGPARLMLGPRADDDVQALLSLISPDDAGFLRLARLLSDRETDSLPSGLEASIWDLAEAEPVKPRVWKGVAPPADQFTLARLGLDDLTVHGFRGGVIEVPLHYLPDEAVVSGIASVDLVFSFANQIVEGSRLRIYLNHEILAEKVLTDLPGTARQRVSVGLPTARLGPMSSLQLHFDLRGHEAESCLGAAHAQLWATVHADTRVTMPRRKVTRILDLSLLRFGAFPLGLRADLSELLFLLPRAPAEPELRAAAVLAAELGRLARADRVSFDLRFGSDIPEALSKRDLVIVGALGAPSPRVDGAASSSASTLLPAAWAEDGEGGKKASAGILMEIDESPLDDDYNALTLTLPGLASLSALDACPGAPRLLERVVGRVARLSGCEGHEVVTGRSIPFEGTTPIREGAERWVTLNYWTFLEVFALLVLLVLLLRYLVREIGRHLAGRAAEKRGETEWQE